MAVRVHAPRWLRISGTADLALVPAPQTCHSACVGEMLRGCGRHLARQPTLGLGWTPSFASRSPGRGAASIASASSTSGSIGAGSRFAAQRDYDGLWSNASFTELGVHPVLVEALAAQNIVRPTVVQADAFRPVARGRDTVLRAETGSGKTLAYLLPLINRIYHLHDRARETALADPNAPNPLQSSRPWVVLAPTADLCAQVLAMCEAVDTHKLVAAQSLQRLQRWDASGGMRRRPDAFQAPKARESTLLPAASVGDLGASTVAGRAEAAYAVASPRIRWGSTDLVVSTPAKFCEDLEQFKEDGLYPACVVLDEADALFQGITMGYMFDIFAALRPRLKIRQPDEVRGRLPELLPTQFLFAAATMIHIGPHSVGNMIIERFCTAHVVETPRFHRLPLGLGMDNVRWVPGSDDWDTRVQSLVDALREVPCERTIVFVNSLHNCHVLLKFLREAGWPVTSFMKGPQGRMGPRFRDAQRFMDGEAPILIATEHGGRGIDWHEVDHVINFQMPTNTVSWLHRVGRTGRMGRRGLVTNFVANKDIILAEQIQTRLADGKDLHGAFSRKRSLARKLKSQKGEDGASPEHYSEDGTYRLQGGMELFHDSLAATAPGTDGGLPSGPASSAIAGPEGTLLGYMPLPDEDAGTAGKRLRQRARGASSREAPEGGKMTAAGGDDDEDSDPLARFRKQLLESSDSEDDTPFDDPAGDDVREKSGPQASRSFQWSMLKAQEDVDEAFDVQFGPHSRRQLLNRGRPEERGDARAGVRKDLDTLASSYVTPSGRRKGKRFGVQAASRAAAARNYAAPDDELLL